jgi:O-antigen/teichoic acid export membrane protein
MTNRQLKKNAIRFLPVLLNGLRSILSPVFGILFSYTIVTFFSKELWGDFVNYLLFFLIVSLISNWGSKTFLMRAFSQNPKNIVTDWQALFMARLPVCMLCVISIFFFFEFHLALFMIIWVVSAFVYHSFFSIIFYNRDYEKMIAIEMLSFLALLFLVYLQRENLSSLVLVQSYAIHVFVKALLAIIFYPLFFNFKSFQFNSKLLWISFPFFLLGISGFLQSKIDIYAYSFYYDGKPLGEYQIISGFFIFSQSMVMLLIFPYVKNIYRMSTKSIDLIRKNSAIYGFVLNSIVVVSIYFALLLFDIKLSTIQVILGFMIGYPCYIYTLDILLLFKTHKEYFVIKTSIICLSINFLMSVLLLHLDYNITGTLAGNAAAQIVALYCYLILRKKRECKVI